jgi:hypothetical protein
MPLKLIFATFVVLLQFCSTFLPARGCFVSLSEVVSGDFEETNGLVRVFVRLFQG